jgi:hypothetical protein
MANQVGPGTVGGAAQQPGGLDRAAEGAGSAGYAAVSPDTFGTEPQTQASLAHQAPGSSTTHAAHVAYHGRPVSWVAVSLIMVGFVVGGLALVFGHHGPTWWLFWTGAGLAAIGALLALASDIFEDWY